MPPRSPSPIHPLDALRRAGLAGTAAQAAVLDYLQHAEHGHYSAEEIHRRITASGERMNLSTTYRVVNQLVDAELVASVPLGKHHSLYELNRGKAHDHSYASCADASRNSPTRRSTAGATRSRRSSGCASSAGRWRCRVSAPHARRARIRLARGRSERSSSKQGRR
ncbi:Fur family transcriptional regulator [Paraburkholderia diazotrophica]|uniref:Fur family transcriptional regulator n=1 Tax=Paraburkholderia diazotrophica TaxID=667676 RepID=UPI001FE82ACC|nr:transcriptional repressor [Paraburkholderia diazotrophica]